MTISQARRFLKAGAQRERRRRAAFIADMHCAGSGIMGDSNHVQERIDELNGE